MKKFHLELTSIKSWSNNFELRRFLYHWKAHAKSLIFKGFRQPNSKNEYKNTTDNATSKHVQTDGFLQL